VTAGPAVCKSEVVDGKFLPFPVFEEWARRLRVET
jgi:hypothetical protein